MVSHAAREDTRNLGRSYAGAGAGAARSATVLQREVLILADFHETGGLMLSKQWQAQRRQILKAGSGGGLLALAVAAGLITPFEGQAQQAWNSSAFDARNFAAAIKSLGGASSAESKAVLINAPDVAENGMMVPIAVTSNVPQTRSIAILIEENPNPLAAVFEIPDNTNPFINTRVKMAQSSNVYALVRARDGYFHAIRHITVTVGGCGG